MFADNLANGLWFDESVYDIKLLNSRVLDNAGHGVSIEISGKAIVMGNVIARNRDNGLKVNNSEDVQVWNNTFADNNRSINVVQDDRDLNSQGSFRDPDMPLTWRTQSVVIRNNVISRTGAVPLPAGEDQSRNCLLCVEDFSGRWTAAEMDVTALGNVYHRASASAPKWIVVWARRSKDPYVFRSVSQFSRTAHQEDSGVMYTGRPILTDDLQLEPPWCARPATSPSRFPRTSPSERDGQPARSTWAPGSRAEPPFEDPRVGAHSVPADPVRCSRQSKRHAGGRRRVTRVGGVGQRRIHP